MGRNRVRKTTIGTFTHEEMSNAVDMVLNGVCSIREAARRNNLKIPTVARYVKKKSKNSLARMCPKYNSRQVFTSSIEKELVNYLLQCSKMCYGIGYSDCRKLAFQLALKNNLVVPHSWIINEMAGIDWMKDFIRRNPTISLRKPEACSLSRATSFNRHNVSLFFDKLENVLKRHDCFGDGSRIYNLDETGVTTVQTPKKVIAQKGVKRLNQITSAERGVLVTVCCIINAYGHALPPVILFPRVHLKNHMINGAPPGTLGLACQSGWMNTDLFIETLLHFIKFTNSSKENPALLIMDNHESHISLSSIDLAKSNGVTILTLPPHCSNRLQPLDVSVYGPFKKYYNSAVDAWLQNHPGITLDIYNIAPCINSAFDKSMTMKNIQAGFKATGIYPFDKNIFTDDDYLVSAVTDRPYQNVDTSIVNNNLLPQSSSSTTEIKTNQNINLTEKSEASFDKPGRQPLILNTTESTNVSPDTIRPYPKADDRKNKMHNKRKKVSAVVTDTPEKLKIEEATKTKNEKIKKSLFPNKTKIKNIKKISKPTKPLDENNILSDSSADMCGPVFTSDVSDAESFSFDEITGFEELEIDTEEGDYVLVRFACSNSKQAKKTIFYVGKIIKNVDNEGFLGISYLRSYKKSKNKFVLPQVPDLSSVCLKDITAILPKPKINGKTARQQ
ncbi:unnamed protein product [Macrosiphum euphorbiae]|uniref:DDE-1 domain-containing protein n=1 Tax=Macrosiphum euphorbiae TaxID=13131 RepID=A0AAV0XUE7_9HEMI|nr:unnamed protein product [Macrosiphum euphorbiae]